MHSLTFDLSINLYTEEIYCNASDIMRYYNHIVENTTLQTTYPRGLDLVTITCLLGYEFIDNSTSKAISCSAQGRWFPKTSCKGYACVL